LIDDISAVCVCRLPHLSLSRLVRAGSAVQDVVGER
jgi:hypothetical protein